MSQHPQPLPRPRRTLDKLLSVFTEVNPGESGTALLLALNAFLLLTAYYIIKPLREALILGGAGAEVKSYTAAGQALLLLGLVPAYSAFAKRTDRSRLIAWVTLFFISNLVVFWLVSQAGASRTLGIAFFLWVGIFNVMIVAQFWGFANDVYTPEQGKRLFALIAFGASAGAIAGAKLAEPLIDKLGVRTPMLVAGVVLLVCIGLTLLIHHRSGSAYDAGGKPVDARAPLGGRGGFQLVFSSRYLLLIAFMILIYNAVNTNGEYILGKIVRARADHMIAGGAAGSLPAEDWKEQFIGKFYANFFFWVNWVGAAIQLLLVSRIFKWFGVRVALFVLPIIALGGYAMLAGAATLALVRGVKIAENATDYSLQSTTRHALFLPTSREAKYKAKAAIDSFFWRMGDLVSAGCVYLGTKLALEPRNFAAVNLGLVVVWLLFVIGIARHHARLTGEAGESSPSQAVPSAAPPAPAG